MRITGTLHSIGPHYLANSEHPRQVAMTPIIGILITGDAGRGAPLLAAAPVGQARVEEEAVEKARPRPAEPERVRVVGGVAFVHAEKADRVEAPAGVPGDEGAPTRTPRSASSAPT